MFAGLATPLLGGAQCSAADSPLADNAALAYWQAFALLPELDDAQESALRKAVGLEGPVDVKLAKTPKSAECLRQLASRSCKYDFCHVTRNPHGGGRKSFRWTPFVSSTRQTDQVLRTQRKTTHFGTAARTAARITQSPLWEIRSPACQGESRRIRRPEQSGGTGATSRITGLPSLPLPPYRPSYVSGYGQRAANQEVSSRQNCRNRSRPLVILVRS